MENGSSAPPAATLLCPAIPPTGVIVLSVLNSPSPRGKTLCLSAVRARQPLYRKREGIIGGPSFNGETL